MNCLINEKVKNQTQDFQFKMQPSFHARTGIPIKKREEKIDPNFTTTYVVKYFASDFSDLGYFI